MQILLYISDYEKCLMVLIELINASVSFVGDYLLNNTTVLNLRKKKNNIGCRQTDCKYKTENVLCKKMEWPFN